MFATRSLLAAGAAICCFAAGAPPTLAAGAEFVGTPSVRYEHGTVGVVARFDEAIGSSARAELSTAPSLRRGEQIERAFGGNSLGSVGRAANHCYVAEAARPEPRASLRDGASWEIGFSTAGKRIADTARVTLRHQQDAHWVSAMARRLGCYER